MNSYEILYLLYLPFKARTSRHRDLAFNCNGRAGAANVLRNLKSSKNEIISNNHFMPHSFHKLWTKYQNFRNRNKLRF